MDLLNIRILLLTFAAFFHSIDLSSQAVFYAPPPFLNPAPSYVIQNGVVHLTGDSAGGEAVVIDGYFLGSYEHGRLRPVDPHDINSVLRVQNNRFVNVSLRRKENMLCRYSFMNGHHNHPLCNHGPNEHTAGHHQPR